MDELYFITHPYAQIQCSFLGDIAWFAIGGGITVVTILVLQFLWEKRKAAGIEEKED